MEVTKWLRPSPIDPAKLAVRTVDAVLDRKGLGLDRVERCIERCPHARHVGRMDKKAGLGKGHLAADHTEDLGVALVVPRDFGDRVVVPPSHVGGIERQLTLLRKGVPFCLDALAFGDVARDAGERSMRLAPMTWAWDKLVDRSHSALTRRTESSIPTRQRPTPCSSKRISSKLAASAASLDVMDGQMRGGATDCQ